MRAIAEGQLFEEYKKRVGDQTLFNGVHNFTILINSLAWTQKKHFAPFFEMPLPCISFSVARGTKSTYWVLDTQFTAVAKETFLKYWKNPEQIKELEEKRKAYVDVVENGYKECTPVHLAALSEEALAGELIKINDAEGFAN